MEKALLGALECLEDCHGQYLALGHGVMIRVDETCCCGERKGASQGQDARELHLPHPSFHNQHPMISGNKTTSLVWSLNVTYSHFTIVFVARASTTAFRSSEWELATRQHDVVQQRHSESDF